MEEEIVQYYVVNSEINISPGKLAAQVAHVAIITGLRFGQEEDFDKYKYYMNWISQGQKKIILRAKEKKLLELIDQGFLFIRDNGLTEIPKNTLTVVGLPPMYRSEAQRYVKRLQLY